MFFRSVNFLTSGTFISVLSRLSDLVDDGLEFGGSPPIVLSNFTNSSAGRLGPDWLQALAAI